MLQTLIAKYGMQVLTGLLSVALIVGGYYYWKHHVVSEALDAKSAELDEQSNKLLKEKNEEVAEAEKRTTERLLNATKTYAKHYDELRNNPVIIDRVRVVTKTNCSSNPVPSGTDRRPEPQGGVRGTGASELPSENIRELNKTILMIEAMQLKCEQLLNTFP